MNHQIATYIDLIQSIGFFVLAAISFFAVYRILIMQKKENEIHPVKITVDK